MEHGDGLSDPHAVTLLPEGTGAGEGSSASQTRAGDEPRGRSRAGDRAPPASLGRYRLLGVLGRGGMGTVHEAIDDRIGRGVALKLLHADLAGRHAERLVREARALARLSHPNVVQVYEVGREAGRWFIAMERIAGQTLREWQDGRTATTTATSTEDRRARPSWRACLAAYLQAGEGLAAAHRAGLTHRDFKPGNCIIDDAGRVRVLDFGLARDSGDASVEQSASEPVPTARERLVVGSLTRTGEVLGTLGYMPLEQLEGRGADARSDQWSFCASLYEAVYGERPFAADTAASLTLELMRGTVRPAPPSSDVPRRLRRALVRGLAKDPSARWPSMNALLAELGAIASARRTWWTAALAGVVVAGLGLANALLEPSQTAEPALAIVPEPVALALADDHLPSAAAIELRELAEDDTAANRADALGARLERIAPDQVLPEDASLAAEVMLWRARLIGDRQADEAAVLLRQAYFMAHEANLPSIESRAAGALAGNPDGAHSEGVAEWMRLAWVAVERTPWDRSAAIEISVTAAKSASLTWEIVGDAGAARELVEFADAVAGDVEPEDDAFAALQLIELSSAWIGVRELDRALHWALRARTLLASIAGPEHPLWAKASEQIGLALHPGDPFGGCDQALPYFDEARAGYVRHHNAYAAAMAGFEAAGCLRILGRHEAALAEMVRVNEYWAGQGMQDVEYKMFRQNALLLTGHILFELGRREEAAVEYERLLALVDLNSTDQKYREDARRSLEKLRKDGLAPAHER